MIKYFAPPESRLTIVETTPVAFPVREEISLEKPLSFCGPTRLRLN